MVWITKTIDVDVEVELSEIDTRVLEFELEQRSGPNKSRELIQAMYDKYRLGKPIDDELRKLFYRELGRIA